MYNFHIIYTLDYDNDREVGYDFVGTIEELEKEISKLSNVSNIFVHCGNGNRNLAFDTDNRIRKYNATAGY